MAWLSGFNIYQFIPLHGGEGLNLILMQNLHHFIGNSPPSFAAVAGKIRTSNCTGILFSITGESDSNSIAIWGPQPLFHTTVWRGAFPCNSYAKFSPFYWQLTSTLLLLLPVKCGSQIAQAFLLVSQVSLIVMAWQSGVHIHCFIPLFRGEGFHVILMQNFYDFIGNLPPSFCCCCRYYSFQID
jgi:hypothetical protein